MPSKKAQSAVELIIVMGFLILFFIVFIGTMQSQTKDKHDQKKIILVKDIIKTVQEEIDLATQSTNGYQRQFEIPEKITSKEYQISNFEGIVYLNTSDGKTAIAGNIKNVTGTIQKGTNTIKKQNGIVYLN